MIAEVKRILDEMLAGGFRLSPVLYSKVLRQAGEQS